MYDFVEFVWTFADGVYTAKAKYVSDQDPSDVHLFDAEMSYKVKLEPTCEEKGIGVFTASYDGHTDTREVDIDPISHDYKFDSFVWAEDYSAQAKYVCAHDAEHVKYYTAEVDEEVIRVATYDRTGFIRYTASFEGHSETKDRETDALSPFTFELNEDGTAYTITKIDNLDNMELLVIPAEYEGLPVTAIADNVANNAQSLRRVVFPETLTSIGTGFLANAQKLSYVYLPKTIQSIGSLTFGYSPRAVFVSDAPSRPSTWKFSTSYTAYYGCTEGANLFTVDGVVYKKTDAGLTVIASDPLQVGGDGILSIGGETHKVTVGEEALPVIGINIYAFFGVNRAIVELDSSLTIANNAFYDCTAMTIYAHASFSSISNDSSQIYRAPTTAGDIVLENDWYGVIASGQAVLLHYIGDEYDITIPTSFMENGVSTVAGHAISGKTLRSIYVSSAIPALEQYAFVVSNIALMMDADKTPSGWSSFVSGSNNRYYYRVTEDSFIEHDGAIYVAHYDSWYERTYLGFFRLVDPECQAFVIADEILVGEENLSVKSILPNAFIDSSVTCVYIPRDVDTIYSDPGLTNGKVGSVIVYTNASDRPSGWNTSAISGLTICYGQSIDSLSGLFIKDGLIYQTIDNEGVKTLTVLGYQGEQPSALVVPDIVATEQGDLPVTAIGERAFYGIKGVSSVTLSGVVELGAYAFGSSSIETIDLGDSLQSIANYAFYQCHDLAEVHFPENTLRQIGTDAFYYCTSLREVHMPASVTSFGNYCFGSCSNLVTFTFPDEFEGEIPSSMFSNDGALTEIVIPRGVTSIGYEAFSGCSGLMKVKISEGVQSIGANCFSNCSSLMRLDIPLSVTSVGNYAFSGFTSASTIFIEATSVSWSYNWKSNCQAKIVYGVIPDGEGSADGFFYYLSQDCAFLAGVDSSITGEVVVPENVVIDGKQYKVRKILAGAFKNNTSITRVTLPEGITAIGDEAFYGCSNLTEINLPEGLVSIGDSAFYSCKSLAELIVPDSCTSLGRLFIQYTALKKISIPMMDRRYSEYFNSGTIPALFIVRGGALPDNAFSGSAPQAIELYEGVTAIGASAFANVSNIYRLIVPASVETVGKGAFNGAGNLTVYFRANEAGASWASGWNTGMNKAVFGFNTDNKEVYASGIHYLVEEDHVSVVYFDGDATQVDLPAEIRGLPVTRVEIQAFQNQANVKVITVPNTVTFIGKGAFMGCSGLETLRVPFLGQGIGKENYLCYFFTVGDLAYYTTDDQRGAVIPASLLYLRIDGGALVDSAFGGSAHLKKITLGDSITRFGSNLFSGCTSLEYNRDIDSDSPTQQNYLDYIGTESNPYMVLVKLDYCGKGTVRVHADCEIIYQEAFANNTKARVVVLPDGIKAIGMRAFYNTNIYSVNLPDSITSIGSYAFSKSSLQGAYFGEESQCTSIDNYAFYDIVALEGLTLPGHISTIGSYAFSKTSLTHIDVPASCTYVYTGAFSDVYNSSTVFVYVPSTTCVQSKAFANLGNARIVTDADTTPKIWVSDWNSGSTNVRYGITHDRICTSGDVVYIVGYYGTTGEAIAPAPVASTYAAGSRDLVIPNQVIQGERPAFTVTEIAPYAFYGCLWLKSISFEDAAVEIVGEYAFYNCTNVTSCVLNDAMYYIGNHAFYALNDAAYTAKNYIIYVGSSSNPYLLCIGANRSFSGGTVTIENGCKFIDSYAFYQRSVSSVTLPAGLLGIWESAFADNSALAGKTIFIPGSVLYMGQCIFQYNRGMSLYLRCGASSRPSGWSEAWNYKNNPIISTDTYSTTWGVSA